MPQTVYLEDGTAIEVPTEDEVRSEIEQKVGESKSQYESRIQEMEEEINPNWKQARETIKMLRDAVKAKGIEVDDNGRPINPEPQFNKDEIMQEAKRAAREEMLRSEIESQLDSFGEKKDLVKHYFDKLTAGEELNIKNISEKISEAETLAFRNQPSSFGGVRGSAPRRTEEKETFDQRPEGKDLMSAMGLKAAEGDK